MNNDLISRSALIQHAYSAVVDGVEKDIIDLSDVDNAPTVEPEKAKESELIKAYAKGFDTGVETVKDERPKEVDLIRRSKAIEELNYLKHIGYDNSGVMKLQNMEIQRCISVIEDVPAEDTSGSEYFPYRTAYFNGVEDGEATAQGKLAEKLKDRIEESVCKYCQMNKHCELCEISRVFSIIALTNEEMKGGAE